VPAHPAGTALVLAYGVTIRDEAHGSTSVGRPIRTMSGELVLVAGRPCDPPGCAVSADPQLSCGPLLLSNQNERSRGCVIGMDIHRTFAEVVSFSNSQMKGRHRPREVT